MTIEFEPFAKMARLSRECVITEKIDGTNAQVIITEGGQIAAGSRTRLIYPGKETDNFGFAAWVQDNREELMNLGPGRHYGEWYGKGIQRGYGLDHKRFALFNTGRWNADNAPKCCHVVPVLGRGIFTTDMVMDAMHDLACGGSVAAPGFMKPEGVVIYHTHANKFFKKTFEKDDTGKDQ